MIKCKVCKYWDQEEKNMGLCRILPPKLATALGHAMWPYTKNNDSCGAGKPK